MICPFCKEDDFDAVGLKSHLINYCDIFEIVPSPWSEEAKTWKLENVKESTCLK